MARNTPVGIRAAWIGAAAVFVAAVIGAVAVWRGGGSSQTVSNSTVNAPVVQSGPGSQVNVTGAPPVREVQADGNGQLHVSASIGSQEPYADGMNVAGITWRKSYVDIRLDLLNTLDSRLDDVNLALVLDTYIAGIALVGADVPGFTAAPAEGEPSLPASLTFGNDKGESVTMPLVPVKAPDALLAKVFRIVIPHLAGRSAAHLVIASVAVNAPEPGCAMPDTLFAPRRNPVGGLVDGAYMVTNPRDPQRVRVRAELHF